MSSSLWLQILFVVVYSMQSIHCSMHNTPGETQPPRVEIQINSNANITCRMNLTKFGSNVNSSSLYFVEEDTDKRVPETDIEILNETTIVFMLRNARKQDRKYVCKSGGMGIGITHVSVGTAPLDVTDFECRGYDYTYMVCSFTIPDNFITTKYSLNYTAQSLSYIQICRLEVERRHATCNLTDEDNNYRKTHEFFNFTLRGENDLGTNVQSFWINNYESVIPHRPEYTFEKITNNSVVIKWHNNKYVFYAVKGLEYEIRLRPKNRGIDWVNHPGDEIYRNGTEYKLIVRNIPFANFLYELSLRVRVNKMSARYDDSYWSEPYIQEFRTAACPPAAAPLTDVGSFYIDPTETQLRLYWHELPDYMENGPDFQYIIKQVKVDGIEDSMKPLHIDRISAVFSWHRRHRYEFVIKSRNAEGESPGNSTIVIPPWSKRHEGSTSPEWIRNVYDATNHTYTLSWSAPRKQQGLIDYTVFWCQSKKATPNECEGTINFAHVNKNSTRFITSPQKENQNLNLAVSANYHDFNSGMHWMCAADRTSDLAKMNPDAISTSGRSITVQWSSDHVCPSLLEGYNITYCRLHYENSRSVENMVCAEAPITRSVARTARKIVLEKLRPHSTYKIEMVMFSKFKHGKMSDPRFVNTAEEAPSKPLHLKAQNITSNSAVLTWLSPEHRNGILRKYRIEYNNEHYIIDCLRDDVICSNREMTFTLENLSSYTKYKVYIVAYTIAASEHSNDINIDTMVGIPSNPRHIKTKEKSQNILQWSAPEVPSGRVEFYQVVIMVWYKDLVQRQHISNVVGSTECTFLLPVCIDADYRFTLQVRAVNVALRDSEIDHYIFAAKNLTSEDTELTHEEGYNRENEDLKCTGTAMDESKQRALIEEYSNSHKYVQYKSVWEKGPVTNCSDTKLSRITMLALLVVVSSLGVMAAFYVARNKYQKMANITCALPPGLEAMTYPTKNDDGGDFSRSKDFFYNNESRHLLSSISQDSGYIHHNADGGGIDGLTSGSLGYIGSDHSTQYCTIDSVIGDDCVVDQMPAIRDGYMDMNLLKPSDSKLKTATTSGTFDNILSQSENNGEYVPSSINAISALNQDKNIQLPSSFLPTENGYITQIPQQMIPSKNVYVKLHNFINPPTQKFPPIATTSAIQTTVPTAMGDIPVNSSGYVESQMLQKSPPQPPSTDGYTSIEALGKVLDRNQISQTLASTVGGGAGVGGGGRGGLGNIIPPISGYVTQQELSAFAQQQQYN